MSELPACIIPPPSSDFHYITIGTQTPKNLKTHPICGRGNMSLWTVFILWMLELLLIITTIITYFDTGNIHPKNFDLALIGQIFGLFSLVYSIIIGCYLSMINTCKFTSGGKRLLWLMNSMWIIGACFSLSCLLIQCPQIQDAEIYEHMIDDPSCRNAADTMIVVTLIWLSVSFLWSVIVSSLLFGKCCYKYFR